MPSLMDRPTGQDSSQSPPGILPGAGRAQFGQASASAMSMKWSALHDACGAVAVLAGFAPQPMSAQVRNFPAAIRDAGGWRRELAEEGVEDLSAIMEPALSALLSAHARGISPVTAAQTLLGEFASARDGLLALLPPPSAMGPIRTA
jgi:hypothetical protein